MTLRYALTFPDRVLAQVFTNANGALREAWKPSHQRRNQMQISDIRRGRSRPQYVACPITLATPGDFHRRFGNS